MLRLLRNGKSNLWFEHSMPHIQPAINRLSFCLGLAIGWPMMLAAQDANYDESKVPEFSLPDPLVFQDGSAVDSKSAWHKRRIELVKLFEQHVYGTMPPVKEMGEPEVQLINDASISLKIDPSREDSAVVSARMKEVDLLLGVDSSNKRHVVRLLIVLPAGSSNAPVFLGYNFGGNHSVHGSKEISLPMIWNRKQRRVRADARTRGTKAGRWPLGLIVSKGYALVTAYYGDIDPDFDDGFQNGVHSLFPELQERPDNWASIGAWAWGLHRMVDYFESNPEIDASRVAAIGHSRLGKTALWAGATDQRIQVVISNNSGCGGAALARREFGETVKRINRVFPHWFCTQHKQYDDSVNKLPVDQHLLLAAIAPRAVYVASAEGDRWADPKGEFLSAFHASTVYRMLGGQGIGLDGPKMPKLRQSIGGEIGYHIRDGKHDIKRFDWQQFLSFASRFLQ